MGLSRREYAKRRGVSDKAVRKALVSRIAAALLPDDTIDADLADQLWEGNTRVSQRRGKEADRARGSMAAASDPDVADVVDSVADLEPVAGADQPADQSAPGPADAGNVVSLKDHLAANKAKQGPRPGNPDAGEKPMPGTMLATALEIEQERLRRVRRENDMAEGLVVIEAQASAHYFEVLRAVTSSWDGFPDRVCPGIAARFGIEDLFAFTIAWKDAVRAHQADLAESHDDINVAVRP